jgi:lipoprotein-releasing system ATP-binding protein
MSLLVLDSISKHYRSGTTAQLTVLSKVTMEVNPGELAAICGASGCGKTTLLNLIGGLDRPSGGRILWDGRDQTGSSAEELAAWRLAHVGFVFQSYHLLPELTLIENVLVPAWLARKKRRDEASELLRTVGLLDRAGHYPSELSGGEQQRAAIARALINDPSLILADEPTGNLDPETAQGVMNLLLDLARQKKKALLLVTHDRDIARQASRRYRLKAGELERETE